MSSAPLRSDYSFEMDPRLTTIPEVRVDLPLARRILARLEPPIEPVAIERVEHGGASGAIYFVATASESDLVVKVYPREPWWRMAKEFYVAGLMARAGGVLSPRFLSADDSGQLLPFRYAVMTRLAGEPLALCERQMDEGQIVEIWSQAGAQLRRIHDIPMVAFGYIADGRLTLRSSSNRAYIDRAWQMKLAQFRERGGEEAVARAMEDKWSARRDLLDQCAAPKLCHYDFHPGNLLALYDGQAWRLSGVLDFEDSLAADPLLDIAKCVHVARVGDHARWRGLLAGYGRIDRPDWQASVELYRLYQAVEYWNWIAFLNRPEAERASVLAGIRDTIDML